jgi:hypothetical protein
MVGRFVRRGAAVVTGGAGTVDAGVIHVRRAPGAAGVAVITAVAGSDMAGRFARGDRAIMAGDA